MNVVDVVPAEFDARSILLGKKQKSVTRLDPVEQQRAIIDLQQRVDHLGAQTTLQHEATEREIERSIKEVQTLDARMRVLQKKNERFNLLVTVLGIVAVVNFLKGS